SPEHLDVLIIGAGISGISAGYHLQSMCPERSWAILEARSAMGGTWDLFRYPGIRSDSDMHTFGFGFRPWPNAKAISEADEILDYLKDTAREYRIDERIRYGHKLLAADWSSKEACWTVRVQAKEERILRCNFLLMCSGYYDYDRGYLPDFPGVERFTGKVVHPQFWTPDIQWQGKRVVVIGSGATAVTLVPSMAREAAHVTMLQRSPSWILSRPAIDPIGRQLQRFLPSGLAHRLTKAKNLAIGSWFYRMCRTNPERAGRGLLKMVRKQLPEGYDVQKHFTPRYNPWEQRLCLVPNGDLFKSIRSGKAEVVTDQIETFTETGIRLKSGQELQADLVVSATGLELKFMGGIALSIDGKPVDPRDSLPYKGLMLSGIPNLALVFGYTNASWTLRADLVNAFVGRLLQHMRASNTAWVVARPPVQTVPTAPWVDFSSGYFQRALDRFPKQGEVAPWRTEQNYKRDVELLKKAPLEDGVLQFGRP
ncbi:MAG: flavin-containing monooxygenase, partial [Burkholderiales bacterium]